MAPKYAIHGHFLVKSDVFSFGVLMLETVSGQKKNWKEGNASNIIDPTFEAYINN